MRGTAAASRDYFRGTPTACRRRNRVLARTIVFMDTSPVGMATIVYDGAFNSADLDEWDHELDALVVVMGVGIRRGFRHDATDTAVRPRRSRVRTSRVRQG